MAGGRAVPVARASPTKQATSFRAGSDSTTGRATVEHDAAHGSLSTICVRQACYDDAGAIS